VSTLALGTVSDLSRGAVRAALEARVAEPAATAFGDLLLLAALGQVANQLTCVDIVHDCAAGNLDLEITTGPAGLVTSGTTLPAFGPEFSRDAKVRQGVHGGVGHQVDATAMAAITTVGSASLDELLTSETQAAVPAIACLGANSCFVDEFHKKIGSESHFPGRGRPRPGKCDSDPIFLDDADELAALRALFLEFDLAVSFCKQRVVTAEADIDARVETGATLAHEDVTGDDFLAAVHLYAQAFTL
jgi:hypothetical protein